MTNRYEQFKQKWEETKPIRGRSEDIRPIGARRKQDEKIVRVDMLSGEYAYAAQLYRTNVVTYYPDGIVEITTGGWDTASTTEFITEHSPFMAGRKEGNVWIRVPHNGGDTRYIPVISGGVRLQQEEGGGNWLLLTEIKIKQRVVDRAKSREIRDKIRKFTKYAETILKLSDGWIRAETLTPYRKEIESNSWGYVSEEFNYGFEYGIERTLKGYVRDVDRKETEQIIDLLSVEDTNVWDRAMYCILHGRPVDYRVVREKQFMTTHGPGTICECDYRYEMKTIHGFVTKIVQRFDVYKVREVELNKLTCIKRGIVV